jgi:hypothetical protein
MTRAFVPALFFCKERFPARILIAKPQSTFTEYALHFAAWRATTRANSSKSESEGDSLEGRMLIPSV